MEVLTFIQNLKIVTLPHTPPSNDRMTAQNGLVNSSVLKLLEKKPLFPIPTLNQNLYVRLQDSAKNSEDFLKQSLCL